MAKSSKKLGLPAGTPRRASGRTNHVRRPPNAWILFRSFMVEYYNRTAEPDKPRLMQSELSALISKRWHSLPPEEVSYWHAQADAKKAEHARLHPDYTFAPESKTEKAARLAKEKEDKAAARDAARDAKRQARRAPLPASAFTNKALGGFAVDVTDNPPVAGPSTHYKHETADPDDYIPAAVRNAVTFASSDVLARSGPQGPSPPLSLATTPESFNYLSPAPGPSPLLAPSPLSAPSPAPAPTDPSHLFAAFPTRPDSTAASPVQPQLTLPAQPQLTWEMPAELSAMDVPFTLDGWANDAHNLALPLAGADWFALPPLASFAAPPPAPAEFALAPGLDLSLPAPAADGDALAGVFDAFDWSQYTFQADFFPGADGGGAFAPAPEFDPFTPVEPPAAEPFFDFAAAPPEYYPTPMARAPSRAPSGAAPNPRVASNPRMVSNLRTVSGALSDAFAPLTPVSPLDAPGTDYTVGPHAYLDAPAPEPAPTLAPPPPPSYAPPPGAFRQNIRRVGGRWQGAGWPDARVPS